MTTKISNVIIDTRSRKKRVPVVKISNFIDDKLKTQTKNIFYKKKKTQVVSLKTIHFTRNRMNPMHQGVNLMQRNLEIALFYLIQNSCCLFFLSMTKK